MKKILLPLMALTAGALLFSGCAREGAYAPVNTTRYNIEDHERFVLLDKPTQRSVTVSRILLRPLEDGRLEVAANVRNRLNRRIQVQINCEFKDQFGVALDSTPFETLILSENEQRTVRYVSMNDRAKDFTMRVRQAR